MTLRASSWVMSRWRGSDVGTMLIGCLIGQSWNSLATRPEKPTRTLSKPEPV
ncbi:hypothetical protein DPMN_173043 [Dreissena polymorpha]|uniref:Uncharacterized protein n=1 Tax=Dreissena polymorpha TaxID=45954 RepID=A0A9D4E3C9_DREPO|nr:hypothetical protein DPMN_173043 [Dreissena polymorpha]